jgi:hypothetical protein
LPLRPGNLIALLGYFTLPGSTEVDGQVARAKFLEIQKELFSESYLFPVNTDLVSSLERQSGSISFECLEAMGNGATKPVGEKRHLMDATKALKVLFALFA